MEKATLVLEDNSSMVVSGQSGSGKSMFCLKLIENLEGMFQTPPSHIYYCYGVWQKLYEHMENSFENISFHEGVPSKDQIQQWTDGKHNLLILDDLGQEAVQNREVENLFTKYCHHLNFSCILILQNIFQQGSSARTIALNAWYTVLFKNPRDAAQVAFLGRQMHPSKPKMLVEVYEDCTSQPFSYLFLDTSPHMEDAYRMRTRIFPGEIPLIYVPKKT